MLGLINAIASHPETKFFRVLAESDCPQDWKLEPLPTDILSDADSDEYWYYLMKAFNVLPDGMIRDCYIDMSLPERLSDYAFFVENASLRVSP